ncbi:MAG: hypothetical protein H8E13_17445 [Actinobacteria bacterium]|nr:hypothetical protein [Actinomycetota bacterium]
MKINNKLIDSDHIVLYGKTIKEIKKKMKQKVKEGYYVNGKLQLTHNGWLQIMIKERE